eukprot:TRINITY_DN1563_c0_g1_i1.p1 TRINITY_DN1563_c0_g1~~TRINITY_DN1563_c0_g1_i1.p1  ORF type:complete len:247 (-),score=47.84 TRINITY_DN1563_c0_g1_i1:222-962(-)
MEEPTMAQLLWQEQELPALPALCSSLEPFPNPEADDPSIQSLLFFSDLPHCQSFQEWPQPMNEETGQIPNAQLKETSETAVEDQSSGTGEGSCKSSLDDHVVDKKECKKRKSPSPKGPQYAIKMKSEKEVMEDGYKWRKYGRKRVKSSPHTRNYYKCSERTCNVKKKVERDSTDPSMIIAKYEGRHNHESPSKVVCVEPLVLPQQGPGSKPTIVFLQTPLSSEFFPSNFNGSLHQSPPHPLYPQTT